ncbi:hypothetical protein MLD38_014887 [Melastoma candidum]|uniref:Uncharacterized protein n=1 Tax=Melastoma candidum TaxID=119954 RepID=A0ACB9RFL9_9MYRT|nr:hypothetical protein MLD38_014887 [Melastoma candidum]
MSVSMRDLDPAFHGAGQKAGIEIWRIEDFRPVSVPQSSHGKFFTGDSYVILKTAALKNGALCHDIHYWLGKDTSQDEAGTAAMKTVELDAALGGRAVQYREVQGRETEKFLSYFKPCIIPVEGGVASGFKHAEEEEHMNRLFVCRGKHVVHVTEVPFARSSLNHDDIFILDTKSKIFQFNGSNSSIQERAKALEVVQYVKDTYHDGKCDIASIADGRLMADSESGEFWGLFGGFAPLPRKAASEEDKKSFDPSATKLLRLEKGQAEPIEAESLTRDLLETSKCYLLDCGIEVFVWMGRTTSLDDRKSASTAAEELVRGPDRPHSHVIRIIEGFETIIFRSKFDSWPETAQVAVSEDGRGKVAALLKRQGVNVKGLMKADPVKEDPQPYIDCTGNLQVWRVSGQEKILLPSSDQSKFYSGDCYVFHYSYPGEDKEEYLIGTWFGKQSVEEERTSAIDQSSKMVESFKFLPVQARIYEGKEPIQFFSIFQSFIIFKGGVGDGYKNFIAEKDIQDETYQEDGTALFRVQGSGPENMQAIQVDAVASSLNSSYCYILHNDSTIFIWSGSLTSPEDLELAERQLDLIKPNALFKTQKEGMEPEQFWELLGGKSEYPSQKIAHNAEKDPHLFACSFSNVFVWVGQQADADSRLHALKIGEKFVECDFLLEKLSSDTPIYVIMEGSEPPFFTRFFSWDSAKSAMHGNSFERKLTILKNGGKPNIERLKRRTPVIFSGRSTGVAEKSQRSRSVSFSPERVRVRGRSPAFNAIAANFENPNARNLSTPPPVVQKIFPKSTPDSGGLTTKSSSISALSSSFEKSPPTREFMIPKSMKGSPKAHTSDSDSNSRESLSRLGNPSIQEDDVEAEAEEEGLPTYPYERLLVTSEDPVTDIDVTRREAYLSAEEFGEKFEMTKKAFYKLPKWRQNKLKAAVQLF